jgi:hypothetical protein
MLVVKGGQTHGWIIYIMEDEKNKTHLNGYAWFDIRGTFLFTGIMLYQIEKCFDIMVCIG